MWEQGVFGHSQQLPFLEIEFLVPSALLVKLTNQKGHESPNFKTLNPTAQNPEPANPKPRHLKPKPLNSSLQGQRQRG